jgi:hypothetical protein
MRGVAERCDVCTVSADDDHHSRGAHRDVAAEVSARGAEGTFTDGLIREEEGLVEEAVDLLLLPSPERVLVLLPLHGEGLNEQGAGEVTGAGR